MSRLSICWPFHACISIGLLIDPEDGSDICLRNIDLLSPVYTALNSGRNNSICYYIPYRHQVCISVYMQVLH
jgi:hypothetical protein